jgi:glycosyltransferase involved in cell wall biosynthesis
MRRNVELTVVVPVRNGVETIGEQLDALLASEWDGSWELVVADNGSRDQSRQIVEHYVARDPRVRLVNASDGVGAAHARNAGMRAAWGSAVAFCDADDVVGTGWLPAMGHALRAHDFVTGPLEVHRLNPPWVAGSRGRAIERGPGDFLGLFAFAPTCNLGVRRALALQAGGFDARLAAGEDIEFSLRLQLQGIPLTYVDDAVVHYRYRQSVGALWHQARTYGRAQESLVGLLRGLGTPVPASAELRRWLWLARNITSLVSRGGRARWTWVAGGCAGRLEGRLIRASHRARRAR